MKIKKCFLVIAYGARDNYLVRPRGLEPPRDFSHNDLNVARLPVPPWPQ